MEDIKKTFIFLGDDDTPQNRPFPTDLKVKLSKRLQMDDLYEITYWTQNNEQGTEELYQLLFEEDQKIANNALWAMTYFSWNEQQWLCQKQDELIDEVLISKNATRSRLLLTLLHQQPLANPPRIDFLNFCLDRCISLNEPPAITVLCIKLAYEMCRTHPELLQELQTLLDIMEESNLPPSIQVARKNTLKAIQKESRS